MIQKNIEKLNQLGPMPDQSDEEVSDKLIDEYANLLNGVKTPISLEEAKILIKLFPPISLYGVEWCLLHLIETVYKNISPSEYLKLLNECNSNENKSLLLKRVIKNSTH
jgi:hypothetical protein